MEKEKMNKPMAFIYLFRVSYAVLISSVFLVLSLVCRSMVSELVIEGTFFWWIAQLLIIMCQAWLTYVSIKETVFDMEKQVYHYLSQLKNDMKHSGFWHIQLMTLLVAMMALARFILLVFAYMGVIYVLNDLIGVPNIGQALIMMFMSVNGVLIMAYFSLGEKGKGRQSAIHLVRLAVAYVMYPLAEMNWLKTQEVEAVMTSCVLVYLVVSLLSFGMKRAKIAFAWRLLAGLSPKRVELIYRESIGHLMRNHEQYFPIEPLYQSLANITHMEYRRGANRIEGKTESETFYVMETDGMTFIQTDIRCRYSLLKLSVFIPIHHRYEVECQALPPYDMEEKAELVMKRVLWWKKPIKRVFLSEKLIGCEPPLASVTKRKGCV